MNISITNIEYFPKLSEETCCFSATLCLDGNPIAQVRNHGTGGANTYSPLGFMNEYLENKKLLESVQKWAESLEPRIIQEYDITVSNEIDFVVDDMLDKWFSNVRQKVITFNE